MNITTASTLVELKEAFAQINARMEELEALEPADENSSEYDAWAEECEELAVQSETVMSLIDEKTRQGL